MSDLLSKLRDIEGDMARQKGRFDLFAVFLREGAPDRWDVLVAADWIDADKWSARDWIAEQLQRCLPTDAIVRVSRIVVIERGSAAHVQIAALLPHDVEHGQHRIANFEVNGVPVSQGFVITSYAPNGRTVAPLRQS